MHLLQGVSLKIITHIINSASKISNLEEEIKFFMHHQYNLHT